MAGKKIAVRWVRRNWPVGALPFIIRENDLPRNQNVLVFLPHSDDGRYIGATLSLMNRDEGGRPRNRMRFVVVCPGYHSVDGDLSDQEKSRIRWQEALSWGKTLGFKAEHMIDFGAYQTYSTRRCVPGEQARMDALIRNEKPTMVFVTHRSDITQHTNYCTRTMALNSVTRWLRMAIQRGAKRPSVFVVEYPTLYVPILPPSDKTLIVAFSDPSFPLIKHEANKKHQSQVSKYFEMMGRFVEAIDALSGADAVIEARRAGERFSHCLSEVSLNPVTSRGEHFGITRLRVRNTGGGPILAEERVKFPLTPDIMRLWHRR